MDKELDKKSREQEVATNRKEADDALFDTTLKDFGSILEGEMYPKQSYKTSSPLAKACEILGVILEIKFHYPPKHELIGDLDQQIHDIAVLSNINYRNVILVNGWWNEDHGAMIGFISDGIKRKPIILKPEYTGGYSLIDPEHTSHPPVKINQKIAENILPQAKVFYRKFPVTPVVKNRDLFKFCLHGRERDLFTLLSVSLMTVVLALFVPMANHILFDYVIPFRDDQLFLQLLLGLVLIYINSAVFISVRQYIMLKIETCLNHDVEAALWDRLLNMPMKFFRKFTTGDLLQRISIVTEIRQSLTGNVLQIILNGVFSFIYLIVMFYYSPALSLVAIAMLSLSFVISLYGYFAIKSRAMNYLLGVINGKVVQMVMGLSKIRTNGAERRIFRFWANDAITNQRLKLQMGTINNRINVADGALDGMRYFVIFFVVIGWIGVANSGNTSMISLGAYLAFNIALVNFANSLDAFNNVILEMPSILAMWNYSKIILEHPTEDNDNKDEPDALTGAIRIDHLSFRYDPNGNWIHNDISINISPGEFVAIVGPSGSGKSSLVRLLLGFDSCEKGGIYFDDKDLSTLNLRDVRRQINTVLQNSKIMDGTILDNITTGNLYPTPDIMEAVKKAGFEEDLKNFPMGLHTVLTSGGTTISGGQRQRLFLARSFLNNAPIILWDEATAGLDNKTQEIATGSLEKLKATRIVIAHRLSTVKNADKIYVLDQGKIIESGSFKELADGGGLFSEMLKRQMV